MGLNKKVFNIVLCIFLTIIAISFAYIIYFMIHITRLLIQLNKQDNNNNISNDANATLVAPAEDSLPPIIVSPRIGSDGSGSNVFYEEDDDFIGGDGGGGGANSAIASYDHINEYDDDEFLLSKQFLPPLKALYVTWQHKDDDDYDDDAGGLRTLAADYDKKVIIIQADGRRLERNQGEIQYSQKSRMSMCIIHDCVVIESGAFALANLKEYTQLSGIDIAFFIILPDVSWSGIVADSALKVFNKSVNQIRKNNTIFVISTKTKVRRDSRFGLHFYDIDYLQQSYVAAETVPKQVPTSPSLSTLASHRQEEAEEAEEEEENHHRGTNYPALSKLAAAALPPPSEQQQQQPHSSQSQPTKRKKLLNLKLFNKGSPTAATLDSSKFGYLNSNNNYYQVKQVKEITSN